MQIRQAVDADFSSMWAIFREVVARETTYVFAADASREDAYAYWFGPGIASYVAEEDGEVVAMYKLVANQRDLGSHVANASFMVDARHGGRGIGRQLGEHCLEAARRAGYLAMQFNFVVSTNFGAIKLWQCSALPSSGRCPRCSGTGSWGWSMRLSCTGFSPRIRHEAPANHAGDSRRTLDYGRARGCARGVHRRRMD